MRKFLLVAFICSALMAPMHKAYALNAKGKAFLIICTYGTVGGALLGFASMAFGTNSRAIAQGASLGLYAGIAFGAYVVSSHKKQGEGFEDPLYDQPGQGPPGFETMPPGGAFDQGGGAGGGFGAPAPEENSGGFFGSPQRAYQIQDELNFNYRLKKRRGLSAPIYVPLVNLQF